MSNTVRVVHHSPFGVLDVPLLGVLVAPGEVVEVTEAQAELLTRQVDLWSVVPTKLTAAEKAAAKAAAEQAEAEAKAAAEQAEAEAKAAADLENAGTEQGDATSVDESDAADAAGEGE